MALGGTSYFNERGQPLNERIKPFHELLPEGVGRVVPTSQYPSLALGLSTPLTAPASLSSFQRNISALPPSLEMEYAGLIHHRAQLEEQAKLDLVARAAGLCHPHSKQAITQEQPLHEGLLDRILREYRPHDGPAILESPPKKRRLSDGSSDSRSYVVRRTNGLLPHPTKPTTSSLIVASLRVSERKATFPLPALQSKEAVSTPVKKSGGKTPLTSFRQTWDSLNRKVGAKLSGREKEEMVAELFRRHLQRQNGDDEMYRKIHGLESKGPGRSSFPTLANE